MLAAKLLITTESGLFGLNDTLVMAIALLLKDIALASPETCKAEIARRPFSTATEDGDESVRPICRSKWANDPSGFSKKDPAFCISRSLAWFAHQSTSDNIQ